MRVHACMRTCVHVCMRVHTYIEAPPGQKNGPSFQNNPDVFGSRKNAIEKWVFLKQPFVHQDQSG